MAGKRSNLKEDVRFRVLRILDDNPEITQREIAAAVGISNGGAHYVLRSLLEKGMVKFNNFARAQDKRRYSYALTRKGVAEKAVLTKNFVARKIEEYEALKMEIDCLEDEIDDQESPTVHRQPALKKD